MIKLPKDYKGYKFSAPQDLGVVGYPNKRVLNASPKGVKILYSLYDEGGEDFETAVQYIKDLIDEKGGD